MRVAIVGCGPAGLAAAHAATGLGADVSVYAPKAKTPQRGPLVLQRPLPGITNGHPDGTIHQRVIGGSILDYRYKLYGDINIGINGDILRTEYHGWDHRKTYAALWEEYSSLIVNRTLKPEDLLKLCEIFDLVVSTANARRLCTEGHRFEMAHVAIREGTSYPGQPDNTTIFNGGPEHDWVRSSSIFGVGFTEWPVGSAPEDATIITKPISTACSCYPKVLRTGRFGAWRNETWVDTAYWDTYTAIESAQRSGELEAIK